MKTEQFGFELSVCGLALSEAALGVTRSAISLPWLARSTFSTLQRFCVGPDFTSESLSRLPLLQPSPKGAIEQERRKDKAML